MYHKDVKISNILIKTIEDGSKMAKLTDFGMVDKEGGTPGYCAVEQFEGGVPWATDIYAFGRCLLRMYVDEDTSMSLIFLPLKDAKMAKATFLRGCISVQRIASKLHLITP